MPKGITPIDEYVFTLSNELKELAENELRETSSIRDHSLKAMREWIMSNPRLNIRALNVYCGEYKEEYSELLSNKKQSEVSHLNFLLRVRLDSNFLLRYLRFKKFSVPQAQECLERYLLLRQSYAEIFRNMDYLVNPMQELIANGYIFALPKRDKLGRRIILTRSGVFDPYKYKNIDHLRMYGLTIEVLMENEENQIRGFVYIIDGAGVNLPHVTVFTPKEAVRIVRNVETMIPVRNKELRLFNVHSSVKFVADFVLALMSEKIRNRVTVYTSVESAVETLDASLLPKEYGGITPMADMIALWTNELKASRDVVLMNDKMQVNVEMYSDKARQGAVSALTQQMNGCGAKLENWQGLQGSFRKLEID